MFLVLWAFDFHQHSYEVSAAMAAALSGVAYTIIMLSCMVYGYIYHVQTMTRRNLLLIMLSLAAVGSLLINFSDEITGAASFTSMIVIGMGVSGLLTASLYLINQYSSKFNRGYITGIQTWFGIVGITVQTLLGVILYDFVGKSAPFNLFGVTCVIVMAIAVLAYKNNRYKSNPSVTDGLLESTDSEEVRQSQIEE